MPKERVIVFDGEDKFVAPKTMVYNKTSGEAQAIGDERGGILGGERPIVPSDGLVDSGAKKDFDNYMRRQSMSVTIPSPSEPEFCLRIKQFIQSNGDGLATPEQIMEAYQLFQNNCVEKPKETPIVAPVDIIPPAGEPRPLPTPEPEPSPIINPPPKPIAPTLEPEPKPIVSTPPSTTQTAPIASVPLAVPSLGVPPMRAGGSGAAGGGGGEKEKEPKKSSNWLLWLIIGGVALYFVTRKKD